MQEGIACSSNDKTCFGQTVACAREPDGKHASHPAIPMQHRVK